MVGACGEDTSWLKLPPAGRLLRTHCGTVSFCKGAWPSERELCLSGSVHGD